MSTIIVDTLTGKSTATTLTIGSTPVVSASANSLTIRGEGSAQTSIQQGLAKGFNHFDGTNDTIRDSLNASSISDVGTGQYKQTYTNNMNAQFFMVTTNGSRDSDQQIGNRYSDNATTHHQVNSLANGTANRQDTNTAISVVHGDLA